MINSNKIYPLFSHKIESNIKREIIKILDKEVKLEVDQEFRILISFQNDLKRDEFISKYKEEFNINKKFDIIPSVLLKLTKNQIITLQNNELIKRIEEDQRLFLSMLDVNQILGLNNYRKYEIPYSGNEIIIGIIDNGINPRFESISGISIIKYTQTKQNKEENDKIDENEINHGTLMASIIGNRFLDNNKRIIGIAPNAKLVDLDISNSKEKYYFSNVLEVFDYVLNNNLKLDILLISLTTLEPSDGKDILSKACNQLTDKDFIIICPAGNFGPESYTIGSPSASKSVITIGALTKKKTIAYYSGRGPTLDERIKPDLCLPGSKVRIPLSNDKIIQLSGTSISAALGAGLIALLKERDHNLTFQNVIKIIQTNKLDLNYDKISQGYGTVNIFDIFKHLGYNLKKKEQEIIPYKDLMKFALRVSIEIVATLIIIYLIINFLDINYIIQNII